MVRVPYFMEYFVCIVKLNTFSMQKHLRKDAIHPICVTAGENPKQRQGSHQKN